MKTPQRWIADGDMVMSSTGNIADCSDDATARLMAAAPDLLAACRNAANVLAAIGQLQTVEKNSLVLQQLRDAIHKATN